MCTYKHISVKIAIDRSTRAFSLPPLSPPSLSLSLLLFFFFLAREVVPSSLAFLKKGPEIWAYLPPLAAAKPVWPRLLSVHYRGAAV